VQVKRQTGKEENAIDAHGVRDGVLYFARNLFIGDAFFCCVVQWADHGGQHVWNIYLYIYL
jgi:hypothetical protein